MGRNRAITIRCVALALAVIAAASLDLYKLGSQPFWFDEALSGAIASSHGAAFIDLAFVREASMALYYLTLHIWLTLVPPTDFSIRLLSTIFAIAAIPSLYLVAAELFTPATGLAAALLLAVNPFFLSYAQEARSYALVVFLTLMSWWFILQSCRKPRFLNLATYVCVTTLAIYAHNLAMLIVPAQGTAVLCLRRDTRGLVRIAGAMLAVCLLVLPLFFLAARFYDASADWIAVGIGRPGLGALREVAVSFVGGIAPPRIRQRSLEALFAIGFCTYLWRSVTVARNQSAETANYICAAAAFGMPIALLWGVSQIFPLFIVRYVLICLPFLLVMVAAGWVESLSRWVALPALALLVLLSLWADRSYYSTPSKPEWQQAIEYISKNIHYGDKLVFAPAIGRFEFDHSIKRFRSSDIQFAIVYPRWDSFFEVNGEYTGSPALTRAALNATYERLWIVEIQLTGDRTEQLLSQVIAKYSVVRRKEFRGISVIFCAGDRSMAGRPLNGAHFGQGIQR